jgi:hypothetical protein
MKKFTLIIGPVGTYDQKTEKLRKKAESVVEIDYHGGIVLKSSTGSGVSYGGGRKAIISLITEPIIIFVGFASCSCCTSYDAWEIIRGVARVLKNMGKKVSFIDKKNNKSIFSKRR